MQNRHHLELTWLEDCLCLAETLNFSKASAARYVTQPAFSRRIQSLEEWVGTPLFERNRRGVNLTRAGEVFINQIPGIVRALYTVRNDALDVAVNELPDVVFSATHALSFSFVPDLLKHNDRIARFGSFRLLSDSLSSCERMLLRGDSHFLLCHYHPHMHVNLEPTKFMSIRLGEDTLIPVTKLDPLTHRPLWDLNSKKPFPYLSLSGESGLGRIISNIAPVNRVKRGMEVAFTADLAATLLAMVRAGDGVAWLPEMLVKQDLENGIIGAADTRSDLLIPIEIRLYRPAAKMSRAVEELWGILMEHQC